MTIKQGYSYLYSNLTKLYDKKEAANIAGLTIEKITCLSKIDRIIFNERKLNNNEILLLENFREQLLNYKPVQYVLHEAWFADMLLYVDECVLIPRPETEKLVNWIIKDASENSSTTFSILDIGTGSGCIAIALKSKLSAADITALEISKQALKIAVKNAAANNVNIKFIKADITSSAEVKHLSDFNIIVSNPPYVTKKEAALMKENVILYEPHEALFVPDENPLLFYNTISDFALHHLKQNGFLYFEINESYADEVAKLLHKKRFTSIEIKKDLQGKNRMIKAVLPCL